MRRIRLRRGMRCYGARPMPAARSTTTPELSVVVPVCDEEASLPVLLARLDDVLGTLGVAHELVLVDDGSRDGTAGILRERFAAHPEVTRVVTLRGNHGQHAAVLAGLEHARGRRVVTLDDDLQSPPEEIPKLLAGLDAGHDYVGGVRRVREAPGARHIGQLRLALEHHAAPGLTAQGRHGRHGAGGPRAPRVPPVRGKLHEHAGHRGEGKLRRNRAAANRRRRAFLFAPGAFHCQSHRTALCAYGPGGCPG